MSIVTSSLARSSAPLRNHGVRPDLRGRRIRAAVLLASFLVGACGSDNESDRVDAGTVDAKGNAVSCTVTATATADGIARTITGLGSVACDQTATLHVETCVQWNPSGNFQDIQCMSATQIGAQLDVSNLAGCGLGNDRQYRVKVNATVNGTAQAEKLSTTIGCD